MSGDFFTCTYSYKLKWGCWSEILKNTLWFTWITNKKLGQKTFFQRCMACSEANIAFFVECILHHTISLKLLNYSHFMTREPLFLLHAVKWVVICEYKRVKNYQSKNSFYCILSFLDRNISTSALSWNPIGNQAISTFSGQKPCTRIILNILESFFALSKS